MKQKIVKENKRTRLMNLPNGSLFTVEDGDILVLKSEYETYQGACECYIHGSGEMFWGGCKTIDELNNLLVIPIKIENSL